MRKTVHRLLLWLWRVLPLSAGNRFRLEWLLNAKFVVGVQAIVVDDRGRVLLAHHTYREAFAWGLPGGWIKHAEDPALAIARELEEETGLRLVALKLLGVRRSHDRPTALTLVYAGRVEGTFRRSLEVDDVKWVEVSELPRGIMSRFGDWIEEVTSS